MALANTGHIVFLPLPPAQRRFLAVWARGHHHERMPHSHHKHLTPEIAYITGVTRRVSGIIITASIAYRPLPLLRPSGRCPLSFWPFVLLACDLCPFGLCPLSFCAWSSWSVLCASGLCSVCLYPLSFWPLPSVRVASVRLSFVLLASVLCAVSISWATGSSIAIAIEVEHIWSST